ncbi:hypothetical protein [Spirosoma aerophilum]
MPGSDWDNAGQSGTSGVWECTTNKPGRWALSVTKVSGTDNDIDDGTLTLTAPTLPEPLVFLRLNTYSAQNRNHFYGNTSKSDANGNLIKGVTTLRKSNDFPGSAGIPPDCQSAITAWSAPFGGSRASGK